MKIEKIKSILNVRGHMYMMIDFSSEAIKERHGNYLFKMPCALKFKKKKKRKKEKKNQPGIWYLKKVSRNKVQMKI